MYVEICFLNFNLHPGNDNVYMSEHKNIDEGMYMRVFGFVTIFLMSPPAIC